MSVQLERTLSLINNANSKDPNLESDDGAQIAKELLYSQRMSARLKDYQPSASEHLTIAAHGQHIERWSSKREDYPEGRTGYKKWRAELGLFHAKRVAELMAEAEYAQDDIDRTKYLVQKRGLGRDPETQCLEDVVCLVFLEHYLEDFASKHNEEKLIDIIQKTWAKMSDKGHQAALKIAFKPHLGELINKALTS